MIRSRFGRLANTALALVCVALGVCAIEVKHADAQTYLGLTAGPTFAGLHGGLVSEADGAYGVLVGADLQVEIGRSVVFDAELQWIQKGVSNVPLDGEIVDFRNAYIEVPITFNLLFPIGSGGWSVGPYAGGAVGLNVNCDFRFEGESAYRLCQDDTPGGDAKNFDVSIPMGIAFRRSYPGGFRLSLEVRFYQGLINALDVAGQSARNRVLAMMFSFSPPLIDAGR